MFPPIKHRMFGKIDFYFMKTASFGILIVNDTRQDRMLSVQNRLETSSSAFDVDLLYL